MIVSIKQQFTQQLQRNITQSDILHATKPATSHNHIITCCINAIKFSEYFNTLISDMNIYYNMNFTDTSDDRIIDIKFQETWIK